MLLQLRNMTRGLVAYVLLGLLVIALGIWGINDIFRGAGANNVAEVGGRQISPLQLTRALDNIVRGERARTGEAVSRQDAVDAGVHLQALQQLITFNALIAYAEKLGVSANASQILDQVQQFPNVTNPVTGQLDRAAFAAFAQQIGYGGDELLEEIRDQATVQMLMESMVAGVRAPSSFGALRYAYVAETRVISLAEAQASAVGAVPAPTDAEVQAFYEQSQEQLRLPEFRALTLVYARPDDFLARVDVPDEQIAQEFEARRAALTRPERRTYLRLAAQSQAQANDAAARLARGETPEAVAAALNLPLTRGENQTRTEVPDARVAEAVFSLDRNAAPRVVQGTLTPWAVVRVTAITPAVEPDLAEVRQEIRNAIAQDQAADLRNEAINAFEEARAGGASIADAARGSGLTIVTTEPVAANGRLQSGAEMEGLSEDVLQIAFETPEGEASDFMPAEEGVDVVVAVDRIVAASVVPLEDVREQLVQGWRANEVARRLRALGAAVVQAVDGGQTLAAAARANNMRIIAASEEVNRGNLAQVPARGLAPQIFNAAEGDAVSDIRVDGGAVFVAVVERINRVDPSAQPQIVEAARTQEEQTLMQGFNDALAEELVARGEPERNEARIAALFRSSTDGEGEAAAQ